MKHHWFLPETPDVMGTLREQAAVTESGMAAFTQWARGQVSAGDEVRAAEHAADRVRRELSQQLRIAFTTPMDAEDLFTLSERLDAVLNMAKNVVRDADLLGITPSDATAAMADEALAGVSHLRAALTALPSDSDTATREADAATKNGRHMEKLYARALAQIADLSDTHAALLARDHLGDCLRVGERIELVADRIWYAVVKEQ